jgi:DNA-binding LacI/PurR family transcriptional regulator
MKPLILPSLSETGGGAKYREITEHLRNLISQGDLKPDTRLPSIKLLAKQWETNYFTVQSALTPLANEGLIERTPRRGTFVRARLARLSSVGCYFGVNLWSATEGAFYQRCYGEIQRLSLERNIRCELFIDNRAAVEQHSPLPDLAKAVQNREVQAVMGMMLNDEEVRWLEELKIPLALFRMAGIQYNSEQMFALVLDRLRSDGCRSVGLLGRTYPGNRQLFMEMARARGLNADSSWCTPPSEQENVSNEQFAYHAFKEMWARSDRPQGLFIHHDWECRGAITAILELGVRVPQNLRLVLYRNSSLDYVCPWKVPAIVLDTREVAATFVDYVEKQHRNERLDIETPTIDVKLVD